MSPVIDLPSIVRAVEAALPHAEPFAVVPMLKAQIPHVDAAAGLALLDRIATHVPASVWRLGDDELDLWPEPVAQRALAHVLALPSGADRILALCSLPRRLSLAQQRETLDGILDRTLPQTNRDHVKPISYSHAIAAFVRTLPQAWQEEWIATQSTDLSREARARRQLDLFPETALRRMWLQSQRTNDFLLIVERLPPDLKALALARIRASRSQSDRLYRLGYLDVELTDAERYEVVATPWGDASDDDTCSNPNSSRAGEHLQDHASHLPKVPVELRQRWLRTLLASPEGMDHDLQCGLMALLPSLEGQDHRQAVDALVASVIREGRFYTALKRWDLLPDHALGPLLLRLREDVYGWSRNEIIAHLTEARDPALADRCLQPLLDGLGELDVNHCLEIVRALTRWLDARSNGAVPRALAALPVPVPTRPANPQYVISRVIEQELERLVEEVMDGV